jgi:hypothetical protein
MARVYAVNPFADDGNPPSSAIPVGAAVESNSTKAKKTMHLVVHEAWNFGKVTDLPKGIKTILRWIFGENSC